ncbi:MAG: hypothetical protein HOA17_00510 [Candidatus Melainabacteria bacterium]|jgi:hypothetical protein|nr:hypothetical protein [Candidatus Melainabacteria bacterium]
MVKAAQYSPVKTIKTEQAKSGPSLQAVNSSNPVRLSNTDQDRIKQISKPPQSQTTTTTKVNICTKCWLWIKSWFSSAQTNSAKPVKEINGQKIKMDEMKADEKPFKAVVIHDGLVTINHMKELTQDYIVVFAENAQREGGLFGQTSALRPSLRSFPDSVVGIPVSEKPAKSYELDKVKEGAFTENSPEEITRNLLMIEEAMDNAIQKAKKQGKQVLLLRGGYGTGFSRMHLFSPQTFKGMIELFQKKLGVTYQLDSTNGTYSLEYLNKAQEPGAEHHSEQKPNLWANPWVVMNHGRVNPAAA